MDAYNVDGASLWIQLSDCRLRVLLKRCHSERWLLLWPGLGGVAETFAPFLSAADQLGWSVAAIDPPGHGHSGMWPGELTPERVLAIWANVIRQIAARRVVVGGFSYGAYCAVYGLQLLEVSGAVLLDGGYLGPSPDPDLVQIRTENRAFLAANTYVSWEAFLEAARTSSSRWDDEVEAIARAGAREANGQIVLRIQPEAADQAAWLIHRYSPIDLERSAKPVLLLRATLPAAMNPEREAGVARLASRLSDLHAISLPESGHDILTANRAIVLKEVTKFLAKIG